MAIKPTIPAVLGVDFGTSSCRVMVVGVNDGALHGAGIGSYASGRSGVIGRDGDPDLARQHPGDYETAFVTATRAALGQIKTLSINIMGIGVDSTGSTVLPLDGYGRPLAMNSRFAGNLSALAWLWKDHTSHREASALVASLSATAPEALRANGGAYSSENLWAKVARCRVEDPVVADAAETWMELCDYAVGHLLSEAKGDGDLPRSAAAATHKGLYTTPAEMEQTAKAIGVVDQHAAELFLQAYRKPRQLTEIAAFLSPTMADRTGLAPRIPIATGNLDAHAAALGAGVSPNTFAKVLGTSGSDMMLNGRSDASTLPVVEGACGVGRDSIVPGWVGVEFGQPAIGDLFAWGARILDTGGNGIKQLGLDAAKIAPMSHGLLALDWFNGNRSTLMNPRLTGALVGITLQTSQAAIFRALVDAIAFNSRRIFDNAKAASSTLRHVHVTGGVPQRLPLAVQTLADVLEQDVWVTKSEHGSGIGAAIAASVAVGAYANIVEAQSQMVSIQDRPVSPVREHAARYKEAYDLWTELHDSMGKTSAGVQLFERLRSLTDKGNKGRSRR